jgi:hypothetical protein
MLGGRRVVIRVMIRRRLSGRVVGGRRIPEVEDLGQDGQQEHEYAAEPDRPAPTPGG